MTWEATAGDRRRADRRSADAEMRALYEDAPCGFLATTADGQIGHVNATLLTWLGRGADDLAGEPFAALLPAGERVVWLTHHVPRLQQAGRLDAVSLELVRADGSLLPVLLSAVLAPSSTEERPGVRMTLVDASERRIYERELLLARRAAERAEWRMRVLQAVTAAGAVAADEPTLLRGVAEALAETVELSCARVWVAREGELVVAAAGGDVVPFDEKDREERVRRAWETQATVLSEEGRGARVCSAVVPFSYDGEPLGVLEAVVPGTWRGTAADLEVLEMAGTVVGQALDRVRLYERIKRLALYDVLTGLPNRALFLEALDQAVARADRNGWPLALLFVDLDGFKAVNDAHGHEAGDRVLQTAARRIGGAVRTGDVVGRLGGDEFLVLCEAADQDVAAAVAERVRSEVGRPIELDGVTLRLTASVGAAVDLPPFDGRTASALLAAGDAAMYARKRARFQNGT